MKKSKQNTVLITFFDVKLGYFFAKKVLTKRFDSEGISFEEKDSSSQYKCMNGYKRQKEKERERQREGGRGHMYKDIGCAKTSNGWTQSVNLNSLCLYNFCLFTSKPFSHFQAISFLLFAPLLCLWETFLFSFCVYILVRVKSFHCLEDDEDIISAITSTG